MKSFPSASEGVVETAEIGLWLIWQANDVQQFGKGRLNHVKRVLIIS